MTPAERQKRKRRLERAGFAAVRTFGVDGWVPVEFAERVKRQIEAHREDAEKIAAIDPPRGRPPKG